MGRQSPHSSIDSPEVVPPPLFTPVVGVLVWTLSNLDTPGRLDPLHHVQILLAQRLAGPEAGSYTIPGGAINIAIGETPIQAAIRELQEETGLGIPATDLRLLMESPDRPDRITTLSGGRAVYTLYAAPLPRCQGPIINLEPDKHSDWLFYPMIEVLKLVCSNSMHASPVRLALKIPAHILTDCLLYRMGYRPQDWALPNT